MKTIFIVLLLFVLMFLSGCLSKLLEAPDEMEVPSGSSQAICIKTEHSYTFVYQLDGVYLYYIDDILQGDEQLNTIQEQAFLHGESVIHYLEDEFGQNGCVITLYEDIASE